MRFYYICIYSVQLITFVLFSITDLLIELENYKDYIKPDVQVNLNKEVVNNG